MTTNTTTTHDHSDASRALRTTGNRENPCSTHTGNTARTPESRQRRLKIGALCASLLMALGASVGCNDMYPTRPIPAEAYAYKPGGSLAPGDEIRVVFSGAPDLNTQQKIQSNGKVSLPKIGEVYAADRSITSLQRSLTSLYQPLLQDSTVTVSLAGAAAGVYVSGAVLRPGKIPLERPMTLLEAVMEAGGFSPMANSRQVVVVRTENGKSQNYVLDLHQALHGMESTPFYIRPYDVIFVKESAW